MSINHTIFWFVVLCSNYAYGVKYGGIEYDDTKVAMFLDYYTTYMKTQLAGFKLLAHKQETEWEVRSYENYGQQTFETALKTWAQEWGTELHQPLNYVIAGIGSSSTQIAAVINDEVTSLTIEGDASFGANSKPDREKVRQFLTHLKQELNNIYSTTDKDVFVFFVKTIGLSIDNIDFLHLDSSKPPNDDVYSTKPCVEIAKLMIEEWHEIFKKTTKFKPIIKRRNKEPKISNAWMDIAVQPIYNADLWLNGLHTDAVCDIGGGQAVTVLKAANAEEVQSQGRIFTKQTRNQMFQRYLLSHLRNDPDISDMKLKNLAHLYGLQIKISIQQAGKKMKPRMELKQIYMYQTGLIRWFYEQVQKKREKTTDAHAFDGEQYSIAEMLKVNNYETGESETMFSGFIYRGMMSLVMVFIAGISVCCMCWMYSALIGYIFVSMRRRKRKLPMQEYEEDIERQ